MCKLGKISGRILLVATTLVSKYDQLQENGCTRIRCRIRPSSCAIRPCSCGIPWNPNDFEIRLYPSCGQQNPSWSDKLAPKTRCCIQVARCKFHMPWIPKNPLMVYGSICKKSAWNHWSPAWNESPQWVCHKKEKIWWTISAQGAFWCHWPQPLWVLYLQFERLWFLWPQHFFCVLARQDITAATMSRGKHHTRPLVSSCFLVAFTEDQG